MTASITAPRRPFFSSTRTPWMVLPPGLHTASLSAPGWLAALKHQLRTAQDHLAADSCALARARPAGHAAVGQRLDELIHPGRAAAGHAAGRVDEAFRHSVQPPGGGHQFRNSASSSAVTLEVQYWIIPAPTEAGVLGMMRMTGQSPPAIS